MQFSCHPVDASFFETAPMRFRNVVELDARPAEVFAIFADENSWPKWFGGMSKVAWTSDKPYGVGSTRTAWLTAVTVYERFFRWEPDRRFSFYFDGHSMPLAHAFAEDYLLEDSAPGKTRFTYSVGIEPRFAVRMGGPLSHAYFGSMLKKACIGLEAYVRNAKMPATGHA